MFYLFELKKQSTPILLRAREKEEMKLHAHSLKSPLECTHRKKAISTWGAQHTNRLEQERWGYKDSVEWPKIMLLPRSHHFNIGHKSWHLLFVIVLSYPTAMGEGKRIRNNNPTKTHNKFQ
mmetsp:Transcript_35641/g.60658  ORF Transcript_35641/g.60658 Transcript_35641/m.60658 type:complete len:121 (+) Transcript_35641:1251-1613(+)